MYGTQAHPESTATAPPFENDVKMYGTQACFKSDSLSFSFENDVKMYGTQAYMSIATMIIGLRMM